MVVETVTGTLLPDADRVARDHARETCRVLSPEDGTPAAEFEITAQANERRQHALDLLKGFAGLSMPAPGP